MIDAATGVAGKITPGSTVNIYATFAGETGRATPPSPRSSSPTPRSSTSASSPPSNPTRTTGPAQATEAVPITFALNTLDAQRVAYAESFAEHVRLALVAPGSDGTVRPGDRTYTLDEGQVRAGMTTRILPAVGDADAARSITTLLSQLPDAEPAAPVGDSTPAHRHPRPARRRVHRRAARGRAGARADRPGPGPGADPGGRPALPRGRGRPDHRRRQPRPLRRRHGLRRPRPGRPPAELRGARQPRPGRRASGPWAYGATSGPAATSSPAPGGTVVTVSGAKGGVGATVTAVQLALAAQASGQHAPPSSTWTSRPATSPPTSTCSSAAPSSTWPRSPTSRPRVLADAVFPHDTGTGAAAGPRRGRARRGGHRPGRPPDRQRPALPLRGRRHRLRQPDERRQRGGDRDGRHRRCWSRHRTWSPCAAPSGPCGCGTGCRSARRRRRRHVVNRLQPRHRDPARPHPADHRHPVAGTAVPANFKELQGAVDAGRMHELDSKSP